ncbi:MAG: TIR domain-containing protein [Bacilli bacterium]|nr:TIR domain-containing protein [Bacilli bacterium]
MALKRYVCLRCGEPLEKENGGFRCKHCGSFYTEEEDRSILQEVQGLIEEEKLAYYSNCKKLLYDLSHRPNPDSKAMLQAAQALLRVDQSDPLGLFYVAALDEDPLTVNNYLLSANVPSFVAEEVFRFMIMSLTLRNVGALKTFVEAHFKGKEAYERLTQIEDEALKLEEGLYTPSLPRDVFLCYSSKDQKDVVRILDLLEDNGFTVFAAFRNLRHGKGASENYWSALQEAMAHCKCVVFLSSKASRSVGCDAIKLELPYILHQLPQMGRVEYLLEPRESRLPLLVERLLKETFAGVEWVQNEEDLILRVQSLTEAKPIVCPKCKHENAPGTLFCHQCGEPLNEEARKRKEEEQEALARKVLGQVQPSMPKVVPSGMDVNALLTRASLLLEEGDFPKAGEILENVLNHDPQNGRAYLYQYLAIHQLKTEGALEKAAKPHDLNDRFLSKAMRFGDKSVKNTIENANKAIQKRIDDAAIAAKNAELAKRYGEAEKLLQTKQDWLAAARAFDALGDYKDAKNRAAQCRNHVYFEAEALYKKGDYGPAAGLFHDLIPFAQSKTYFEQCRLHLDAKLAENFIAQAKEKVRATGRYGEALKTLYPYRHVPEVKALIDDYLKERKDSYQRTIDAVNAVYERFQVYRKGFSLDEISNVEATITRLNDASGLLTRWTNSNSLSPCPELPQDELCKSTSDAAGRCAEASKILKTRIAAEKEAIKRKKKRIIASISTALIVAIASGILGTFLGILPATSRNRADELFAQGKYEEATAAYNAYSWWGDNATKAKQAQKEDAISSMNRGDFGRANSLLTELGQFEDAANYLKASELSQSFLSGSIDGEAFAKGYLEARGSSAKTTFHYEAGGQTPVDIVYGTKDAYVPVFKAPTEGQYLSKWKSTTLKGNFKSGEVTLHYEAEFGSSNCAVPQGYLENGKTYAYYGSYPKDKVTDATLIQALDEANKDRPTTGNIQNFDFDYQGVKYRRGYTGSFGKTWDYYQWKPLLWRVLTAEEAASSGEVFSIDKPDDVTFLLSVDVIDIDYSGYSYNFTEKRNVPRDDYEDSEVRKTLRGTSSEKGVVYDHPALALTEASRINAPITWRDNYETIIDGKTQLATHTDPIVVPNIEIMKRLPSAEAKANYSDYATYRVNRSGNTDAGKYYWLMNEAGKVYSHYLMENSSGGPFIYDGSAKADIGAGLRPMIAVKQGITIRGK